MTLKNTLLIVLAGLLLQGAVTGASAAAMAPKIVVLPFENLSHRAEYNWIGESFADGLASLLDKPGMNAIQSDERDVAYKQEGLPPTAILTRATMIKIAERAGANLVVMGTYNITGDGRESLITINARTININEGRLVGREFTQGSPLLELERLQGELAYEILYRQNPALAFPRDQFVADASVTPIGALESYIKARLTREHDARVGLFEKALKEYGEKKNGGVYASALFELASIHYEDRDYPKALEEFQKIDEKDSRHQEILFYIGVCQAQMSQAAKALETYQRLVPDLPLYEVYNNAGLFYLQTQKPDDAIAHLKPAADAAPRDTDTLFNLGYAYFIAKDYKNVVPVLRSEVERKPADPQAFYLLSKALAGSDQAAAAEAANQAKKLSQDYAVWETKGIPFWGRIKTTFSKANYYRYKRDQEARLAPQSLAAVTAPATAQLAETARVAFSAGRDPEALQALTTLLQTEPQNSEAHLLMGRIYERRGDIDRAINSLKGALFWNPRLGAAHVLLGRIAVLKNDCPGAKASADKALQIDANDQEALALKRLIADKCPDGAGQPAPPSPSPVKPAP